MTASNPLSSPAPADRKAAMGLLARASPDELRDIAALAPDGAVKALRAPEIGLVMVRGRIGGDGAPFNLGEATVTRAAVALASGEVGFGHVLGRDRRRAEQSAIGDALWQSPLHRPAVEAALAAVRARLADEARVTRERTAATRVDFFTMVRGED
ncbi:phosphonate C-P lyase system protein PhnG [Phreatobacter sp.]|uniref:phosphonate C-P lyase system protein PhnG n=1 Tax=Phreatobacter sp. TaxID=1966341 RepID=UPI003F71B1D2